MQFAQTVDVLRNKYIKSDYHSENDYLGLIKEFVVKRNSYDHESQDNFFWQSQIDEVYNLITDEILSNVNPPISRVNFGTSGWRGIIGKDFSLKSISCVTFAIIDLYKNITAIPVQSEALGVDSFKEAQSRGAVVGYDNRFGNKILANKVADILTSCGFFVYFAGESTTGTLSAAVVELNAAFSINLTPSHNPLEYAGIKYNAADGGPASQILTDQITTQSNEYITNDKLESISPDTALIKEINALDLWISLIRKNKSKHSIDYDLIIDTFFETDNFVLLIDSVHGASRVDLDQFFKSRKSDKLQFLRATADHTFGGIAPEPSSKNLNLLKSTLAEHNQQLKLGVIMDPDADRIRFTDGINEINMNQFGAMAYHFLHEIKNKTGIVAKTVATSNFANSIADALKENVFEPKVGFKEFKPVINEALVCFEESDGITINSHTAEKDAYIGLILAMDMVMTLKQNLGDYLHDLQEEYGYFYPDKDGILVTQKGNDLIETLSKLNKYKTGDKIFIGKEEKVIEKIITIDGIKMIFDDKSWLMIRPSGTEPKVRFYVEARSDNGKKALFNTAKILLEEIGLT